MEDTRKEQTADEGYQLDLDETVSGIDSLMEEALAAVEKTAGKTAGKKEKGKASCEGDDSGATAAPPPAAEEEAPTETAIAAAGAEAPTAEVQELRDRLIRTLADFDNFRKRTEREKETLRRYALAEPLRDFLGVLDNLERALGASGSAEDLKKGVDMIARQLTDLLRRYGVRPLEAVGKPFDPTVHEAVSRDERDDITEPTVVAELQRGYLLHDDRLLRPALVTVAMPSAAARAAAAKEGADQAAADESAAEALAEATEND